MAVSLAEVLWGLVNNAGVSQYGAVEWVSMDDYRSICEVNLFGTIAVTKAFLPLIRSAKGETAFVHVCLQQIPLMNIHIFRVHINYLYKYFKDIKEKNIDLIENNK